MFIPQEWIGELIEVHFYDHISGEDVTKILHCRAWGKLISYTEQEIVIQQWESDGSSTVNSDNLVIIHSTVQKIILLAVVEE